MSQPGFKPATSHQHPREVLEGFRDVQRYALSQPLKGRLAIFRAVINQQSRNRAWFRTSEGFQAGYTVDEKVIGFVHTISANAHESALHPLIFVILCSRRHGFKKLGYRFLALKRHQPSNR
jgi:hypothetical protein